MKAPIAIPCALMRGGTSRGPLFLGSDLPPLSTQRSLVDRILLKALTPLVDSLAGGPSVTTKTAVIQRSDIKGVDIDMHFAQIDAASRRVDWTPLCGNMLSAVGPFAVERGLITPADKANETHLVIRNVSTEALVDTVLQTPEGKLTYDGDCSIAGVEGTAAPIELRFRNIAGAKTGKVLPTGNFTDRFDDVDVTCVDVATPIMFVRAHDFGKTGQESETDLSSDKTFMDRLLSIRLQAQQKMSLPNDPSSVLPKMVMVGSPADSGHISARYFTPWACHPAFAVSGAVCTAAAAALPGTVVNDVVKLDGRFFNLVEIEHPSGTITATLDASLDDAQGLNVTSGGCVRTARKIMDGHLMIPSKIFDSH